jgi:methionine salvage enolase-phosphatase E1
VIHWPCIDQDQSLHENIEPHEADENIEEEILRQEIEVLSNVQIEEKMSNLDKEHEWRSIGKVIEEKMEDQSQEMVQGRIFGSGFEQIWR